MPESSPLCWVEKAWLKCPFFVLPPSMHFLASLIPRFEKMPSKSSLPQHQRCSCSQVFWLVFPHACFVCSLGIYALLGALMFCHVEGNRQNNESEAYRTFMLDLWNLSKDLSGMCHVSRKLTSQNDHPFPSLGTCYYGSCYKLCQSNPGFSWGITL